MTIGQKAEEYLKAQCEKRKDCLVLEMPDHYITDVKQAYIDVSTENGVIWHDLRKDPTDLPKEDCKVYLAIGLDDTEPSLYEYIAGGDGQWEWMPRRIAVLSNDQIKAWCEIPQFKE